VTSFRFQAPIWLWLLILVIAFGVWSIRRDRRSAVLYSNVELLRGLPVTLAQRLKKCLPWMRILGMVLIVFALARPQSGKEEFRIRTEGIAIEMCLDRSGSMQALDFPVDGERVNRLDAVKKVFREFLESADLVKFAAFEPAASDIEASFDRAQEFIQLQRGAVPQEVAA